MRRAGRVVNESPGGIIAHAIVEDTGNDIDFFGPGFMQVDPFPTRSRIDLDKLSFRPVASFPDGSYPDAAAKFFLHGRIFDAAPFYLRHQSLAFVSQTVRPPQWSCSAGDPGLALLADRRHDP